MVGNTPFSINEEEEATAFFFSSSSPRIDDDEAVVKKVAMSEDGVSVLSRCYASFGIEQWNNATLLMGHDMPKARAKNEKVRVRQEIRTEPPQRRDSQTISNLCIECTVPYR
jgi:hypothetical protein